MKKLPTLALALALAFAGHSALADDNSMSLFGGESYKAFEAAKASGHVALARADARTIAGYADNSMSRWNGDSYAAFADSTRDSGSMTLASLRRASPAPAERPHVSRLPRVPVPTSPFSDATS